MRVKKLFFLLCFLLLPFQATLCATKIPPGALKRALRTPSGKIVKAPAQKVPFKAHGAEVLYAKEILLREVTVDGQAFAQVVEKEMRRAAYNAQTVEKNINLSTMQVLDRDGDIKATAVLFSYQYQGQRENWVATSRHVISPKRESMRLRFINAQGEWEHVDLPLEVSGNMSRIDMCLAKLPEEERFAHLKPLIWADAAPKLGDEVISYGYSGRVLEQESKLKKIESRKIIYVNNFRLFTDFQFPNGESGGACGSPLVNDKGELLGMHHGSKNEKISFAITRAGVEVLLTAYYGEHFYTPIKIYNQQIGLVDANEVLYKIMVFRNKTVIKNVTISAMTHPPAYQKLEGFFPFEKGDKVILFIADEKSLGREINYVIP